MSGIGDVLKKVSTLPGALSCHFGFHAVLQDDVRHEHKRYGVDRDAVLEHNLVFLRQTGTAECARAGCSAEFNVARVGVLDVNNGFDKGWGGFRWYPVSYRKADELASLPQISGTIFSAKDVHHVVLEHYS